MRYYGSYCYSILKNGEKLSSAAQARIIAQIYVHVYERVQVHMLMLRIPYATNLFIQIRMLTTVIQANLFI